MCKRLDKDQQCVNGVCAVIVTWNIGNRIEKNFIAVYHQVEKVIFVDNDSDMETINALDRIQKQYSRVMIIRNSLNTGIARAQNQGIDYALDHGFEWVLLLDHDSRPEKDMVLNLLKGLENCSNNQKIAIIAPHIKDRNVNKPCYYITPWSGVFFKRSGFNGSDLIEHILAVISSGSLIRLAVIKDVGFFREDFFVDHVDTEFCLRLITNGYFIIAVRNAVLRHSLGKIVPHWFMGREINVTNHNAQRRYTIYRNRLLVWKMYFLRTPSFILFDFLAALFELFKIMMFETDRKFKLYCAVKGIYSGLTGRNVDIEGLLK